MGQMYKLGTYYTARSSQGIRLGTFTQNRTL